MQTQNPWKILSAKEVYDNNWIHVTEFDVINPSGGKGIYGKVHFKNVATGIVPLDENLNTYIVGQYRFPLNQYSWEIPEGGSLLHDNILESAKRELLEETGLVAKEWKQILQMHLSNSVSDEYCEVFVAQALQQQIAMPEETEQLTIQKLPFEKLYQMTMQGKITVSVSVAAIMKVKLLLLEGAL
jgi:8-oxo-dGTP pyrophosphatase MutT (NUDIX family)